MVQGFGAFGGRGRCYSLWQDFVKCVSDNGRRSADSKCLFEKEDYMECLHGRKMHQRVQFVQKEKARLIKEGKWDSDQQQ